MSKVTLVYGLQVNDDNIHNADVDIYIYMYIYFILFIFFFLGGGGLFWYVFVDNSWQWKH